MLKEIKMVLDRPEYMYDSCIVLSQLPTEMIWFRHKWVRTTRFLEEDNHWGHGLGCFATTDTHEYSGSIILRVAELKAAGYKIVYI